MERFSETRRRCEGRVGEIFGSLDKLTDSVKWNTRGKVPCGWRPMGLDNRSIYEMSPTLVSYLRVTSSTSAELSAAIAAAL